MTGKSQKQFSFFERRTVFTVAAVGATILVALWVWLQNAKLQHGSFTTGYVLLGSLFFLAMLGMRKRLTFLPAIGSASFWMQLHIYVGLASFAIFAMHIGPRIPDGGLEIFLAVLYLLVAFSGFYGLYVTRVVPRKLSAINEEVIFERIPSMRNQIAISARSMVLEACANSEVLAKFYARRLVAYFERPRSLAYALNPSGRTRRQLIGEIEELDRFLAEDQRSVSRKLAVLIRKKDDLDFHQAMQGRLKVWLFVHIGMTYSLLIVAIVHGVLAHAFGGGL